MSAAYDQVHADSREQWRAWLDGHAGSSPGIWLVTWKKGHGPHLRYEEVVDEALCFGWVDSQPRTVDATRSSRLLTPRRPGSSWSRVNKQRVQRLTAAGLMTPAGLAAVRAAQADGSWNALDQVEDLSEPADLRAALAEPPQARMHWDSFPRSTKRAILEWINTAKTDATRTRRVEQTASDAAAGRRANQWRQPKPPKQGEGDQDPAGSPASRAWQAGPESDGLLAGRAQSNGPVRSWDPGGRFAHGDQW